METVLPSNCITNDNKFNSSRSVLVSSLARFSPAYEKKHAFLFSLNTSDDFYSYQRLFWWLFSYVQPVMIISWGFLMNDYRIMQNIHDLALVNFINLSSSLKRNREFRDAERVPLYLAYLSNDVQSWWKLCCSSHDHCCFVYYIQPCYSMHYSNLQ